MTGKADCTCFTDGPRRDWRTEAVGETKSYGEVGTRICPICDSRWLSYFYEHEAFTSSDRSYVGYLGSIPAPKPDDAVALLRTLEPRFVWDKKESRWIYAIGTIREGL